MFVLLQQMLQAARPLLREHVLPSLLGLLPALLLEVLPRGAAVRARELREPARVHQRMRGAAVRVRQGVRDVRAQICVSEEARPVQVVPFEAPTESANV